MNKFWEIISEDTENPVIQEKNQKYERTIKN